MMGTDTAFYFIFIFHVFLNHIVTFFLIYSDVVWPDMKVPQPGVLAKDSFQNKRFKLIPSMVEAPWVVQMAVR